MLCKSIAASSNSLSSPAFPLTFDFFKGLGAQFQAGKSGCGFGDGGAPPQPSAAAGSSNSGSSSGSTSNSGTSAAVPAGFNTAVGDPAGAKNLGNGKGQQFITGACLSDADCASGCCAGQNGGATCSGVGAQFQNGKTGCGFSASKKRSVELSRIARRFKA